MAKPERPHRVEPDGSRSASTSPARSRSARARSGRSRFSRPRAGQARTRSVGVTLLVLLLVPLLALVALWAFVASLTLGNRIRFQQYETVTNTTGPGFGVLDSNLYAERALTVAWLGSARRTSETALLAVRHKTDQGVAEARQEYQSIHSLLAPGSDAEMRILFADLAQLPKLRAAWIRGRTV